MALAYGVLGGLVAGAFVLHLASILLAGLKQVARRGTGVVGTPRVSVLRPLCGLENHLEETLTSTFATHYQNVEFIFCVADADDPVIPLVRRLIAAQPGRAAQVLIGDSTISRNPKLNNLAKGWDAARGEFVLMADSNVLLPADYIEQLLAQWDAQTGLVSSPPAGIRPEGFAARLECAFLNSFQGRWQLAAAEVGNGFAQGKMLFWRREMLDAAGGLAVLGREMAEDVAATKLVRAQGLKVRLTSRLFAQPIGRRRFAAVWARQLRWSKVRRLGFLPLFLPEILLGGLPPLLAAMVMANGGVISATDVALFGLVWYGAEVLLARMSGWPAAPFDALACLCRDVLLPLLWVAAWFGNGFEWRGNAMSLNAISNAPGGHGLA